MTPSIAFPHSWLPAGILAIDPAALALEEGLGNVSNPAAFHGATRAGMFDEDEDTWLNREVEKRCGLRRYPELGIAVQPVSGVMAPGCSKVAEYCGMFNTERIARACAGAVADPQINVLLLLMNTPGGYTAGVEEAAAAVEAALSMKKGLAVIAYTPRICASAGEWVAAAAMAHFCAPSATRGAVGVIASLTDSSRAWREEGLDRYVATDGKYKAMGMPGVPVTEEHKALLLQGVMQTSATFKGYLKQRRGIADEAMQGQTFAAKVAPAGFCDGTQYGSIEELMAQIAKGKL